MYKIIYTKKSFKYLQNLSPDLKSSLFDDIHKLENDPRPNGCKKLKTTDFYRIRIRDFRVIYEVLDKELIIYIIKIGDRKDIYRKF